MTDDAQLEAAAARAMEPENAEADAAEYAQTLDDPDPPSPDPDRPRGGAHLCLHCGWDWNHAPGSPDPPHACARCRSTYWDTPPRLRHSSRPTDEHRQWRLTKVWRDSRRRTLLLDRIRRAIDELGGAESPDVQAFARFVLGLPQGKVLIVAEQDAPNAAVVVDRIRVPSVPAEREMLGRPLVAPPPPPPMSAPPPPPMPGAMPWQSQTAEEDAP